MQQQITSAHPEISENEELRDLKQSLQGLLGDRLLRMTLFGSRARGDFDEDSDYDIAVIVRGLTRELKHQILDKVAEIELEYLTPLSTLVLIEVEFDRLKAKERRIALDIEGEGIPL